jgi:hypothetical protein
MTAEAAVVLFFAIGLWSLVVVIQTSIQRLNRQSKMIDLISEELTEAKNLLDSMSKDIIEIKTHRDLADSVRIEKAGGANL